MTHENPRAVIFGISGTTLDAAERSFFEHTQPLGFILFSRNIETPEQTRALVTDLRTTLKHPGSPVLIDQEGGRVTRLKPSHWRLPPAAAVFGQLAEDDLEGAARLAHDNAWLIGHDLKKLGISVNCSPCIDIHTPHKVIGDRAFSYSPDIAATLAISAIQGFLEAGITPVIKHLPGHGRAAQDTHEETAAVHTPCKELMASDFRAFRLTLEHIHRALPQYSPWGMTAHVTYTEIDEHASATHSPIIINNIIRGDIGFRGLLLSDDITMKALGGSFGSRAKRSIKAGCDIVLHCSGIMTEMTEVADHVKAMSAESWRRYEMSLTPALPLRQEDEQTVLKRLEDSLLYSKKT